MNRINDPSTTISYIGGSTLKRVVKHSCAQSGVLNGCLHESGCSVHNEPVKPNEPCNCGGMKPFCCRIGCKKDAEYIIIFGPSPDDYTESCLEDIPVLMTDARNHEVIRITDESDLNLGDKS